MAEREPRTLKLGVAGLGRAFMLMLPTFAADRRVALRAAADPRPEARRQFETDFRGRSYETVAALCEDPDIDAIYIATPHQFHRKHVEAAAARSKHVLLEKPMALTIADCRAMIDACRRGGVHLMIGHSHSFDLPYLRTRALIESGAFGRVRMITALNFTDFLYRPRRPEELDTAQGGGVVFSQGAHQIDVVRLLGGGKVRTVRAATGAWDAARPTEGAYSAFLSFDNGCFATLTYSGYAHFDSDAFCGWTGELGFAKNPADYGAARRALKDIATADEEAALKKRRTYGAGGTNGLATVKAGPYPTAHNHFGLFIVSCERGDLRPLPDGIAIHADDAQRIERLPEPSVPRGEIIDELYGAVMRGEQPLHSGEWGLATLEVCLAILRSAKEGRELTLEHQIAL